MTVAFFLYFLDFIFGPVSDPARQSLLQRRPEAGINRPRGWDSNGRPLTNFLMKLLQCYDHALVDISPLTQIGAIAILAWVGVLIARRYAIASPRMAALVAFPLGGQPFYLENLSYKFDALSMSTAMLLALLPIIALKDDRRGWWLGILALFASLNFYQPALNAYLIFILLIWCSHSCTERLPGN